MSDNFRANLHEVAMMQRRLGNEEFRIAAARMFEKMEMHTAALAVMGMRVDHYLTPEEIAERERNTTITTK